MVPLDRLLASPYPWVVYRSLLDLADLPEDHERVRDARQQMVSHPLVLQLAECLRSWPGTVLASHKSAGQLYHRLAFAADLGLCETDPGMAEVLSRVRIHRSGEGFYQLPTQVPVHFGGTGEETWAWALCDAPLLLYAEARMARPGPSVLPAAGEGSELGRAVSALVALGREFGWPCVVSRELGRFRGPGKKSDPCPYATLLVLKLLAAVIPSVRDGAGPGPAGDPASAAAAAGIDSLLDCWEHSLVRHPYMFYMGTDFRKLKAPFVWYDLLHVLEVLSQYRRARRDPRLLEMRSLLLSKADPDGLYTPESAWKAWEDWDFGQKKAPSHWLSFLACRILRRFEDG